MGIARQPQAIKWVEAPLPNQGRGRALLGRRVLLGSNNMIADNRLALAFPILVILSIVNVLRACLPSDQIKRFTSLLLEEAESAEIRVREEFKLRNERMEGSKRETAWIAQGSRLRSIVCRAWQDYSFMVTIPFL